MNKRVSVCSSSNSNGDLFLNAVISLSRQRESNYGRNDGIECYELKGWETYKNQAMANAELDKENNPIPDYGIFILTSNDATCIYKINWLTSKPGYADRVFIISILPQEQVTELGVLNRIETNPKYIEGQDNLSADVGDTLERLARLIIATAMSDVIYEIKSDILKRAMDKSERRFKVSLSFSGKKRKIIEKIAKGLSNRISKDKLLYDKYHEIEFAKPGLRNDLQKCYKEDSDIIAVFLCEDYGNNYWCGIEEDAIRDLAKIDSDEDRIILFRFDCNNNVGGFSHYRDGFVELSTEPSCVHEGINKAIDAIINKYISFFDKEHSVCE